MQQQTGQGHKKSQPPGKKPLELNHVQVSPTAAATAACRMDFGASQF